LLRFRLLRVSAGSWGQCYEIVNIFAKNKIPAVVTQNTGDNPTIVSCNATSRLVRFENKYFFLL
jgi:hypothetical protein